jgi:hypothetical protein
MIRSEIALSGLPSRISHDRLVLDGVCIEASFLGLPHFTDLAIIDARFAKIHLSSKHRLPPRAGKGRRVDELRWQVLRQNSQPGSSIHAGCSATSFCAHLPRQFLYEECQIVCLILRELLRAFPNELNPQPCSFDCRCPAKYGSTVARRSESPLLAVERDTHSCVGRQWCGAAVTPGRRNGVFAG